MPRDNLSSRRVLEARERLFESNPYQLAKIKWTKEGNDASEVEQYIDSHRSLKTMNQLDGQYKDISWALKNMSYDEFKEAIDNSEKAHNEKREKKNVERDVERVFENELCTVVVPRTWEASKKYGRGTKWCVAAESTSRHWDSYTGRGLKFYYVMSRVPEILSRKDNPWRKVAVVIYPHKPDEVPNFEGWTATDRQVYSSQYSNPNNEVARQLGRYLSRHGVPPSIFHNETT